MPAGVARGRDDPPDVDPASRSLRQSILGATITPESFFETEAARPRLREPVLVMLVLGALGGFGSLQLLLRISGTSAATTRGVLAIAAGVGAQVLLPFLLWLVYAGAFQLISRMFQGEGEFRTTLALSGWGFLPQVPGDALSSLAMSVAVWTTTPPDGLSGLPAFSRALQADPLLQATAVAGIGFTLWSAYVWVFAVKEARDLSRNQAVFTVAIPVILSIAWTLDQLPGISIG